MKALGQTSGKAVTGTGQMLPFVCVLRLLSLVRHMPPLLFHFSTLEKNKRAGDSSV